MLVNVFDKYRFSSYKRPRNRVGVRIADIAKAFDDATASAIGISESVSYAKPNNIRTTAQRAARR